MREGSNNIIELGTRILNHLGTPTSGSGNTRSSASRLDLQGVSDFPCLSLHYFHGNLCLLDIKPLRHQHLCEDSGACPWRTGLICQDSALSLMRLLLVY